MTDISQRQALEVVAFLSSRGIDGDIEAVVKGGFSRFSVKVESSSVQRAMVALAESDVPAPEPVTSDELLMMSGGWLPASSFVERHRMDRAIASQLEEQVKLLPGVRAVRAILRLHSVSASGGGLAAGGGGHRLSVVVTVKSEIFNLQQLSSIVQRVVPELSEQEIGVTVISEDKPGAVLNDKREHPIVAGGVPVDDKQ